MSLTATCATIAAILAAAEGGETITLRGDCPTIVVAKTYERLVTVDASEATVRGLIISGGNIRWRSGRIVAPRGAFGNARDGYGVTITGRDVLIDSVLITDAKKGAVIDGASNVNFVGNRFLRLGEDGIIASRTAGLRVTYNRFEQNLRRPTSCNVAGRISHDVSQRDCRGTWTDGTHNDAIQLRNGVTDVLLENNIVRGNTQGLTQMDTAGDAPLERVVIRRNSVITSNYHQITLGNCIECRIENNEVRREPGSSRRAVIRAGQAVRCGNTAPDDSIVDRPCRTAAAD